MSKDLEEIIEKVETEQDEVQEQEATEAPKELSPIELEAREMGHVSKEEWEASGKDPEDWVSPREYVRYGKLQKSINHKLTSQERQFNERLENLNKYHEAQRKIEIDSLRAKQKQAVEMADTEAYDQAQAQIDKIEQQAPPVETTPGKDPAITQWEMNNPWVYDTKDDRTIVANARYNEYIQDHPNATAQDALDYVDKHLSKAFPKQNMRREVAQQTTETSTRKGNEGPKKLTMNDLTFEEKQFWEVGGKGMFKSQDEFLQSVADARKGA